MNFYSFHVTNFGSYKDLSFDFRNCGLTLIHGPTGAGKSTICDIPSWILFGVTAKDGNVDEVRSWHSPSEATSGSLVLKSGNSVIVVLRVRGKNSENDLFWQEPDGTVMRGKDINETQQLLNRRLGVDSDLYLSGAYFSEFSPPSSFFVAKAKDRRELFEHIAHLDLPAKLNEVLSVAKKNTKDALLDADNKGLTLKALLSNATDAVSDAEASATNWNLSQTRLITSLEEKRNNFDKDKLDKIQTIEAKSEAFESTKKSQADELSNKILGFQEILPDKEILLSYYEAVKESLSIKRINTQCTKCGLVSENPDVVALKDDLERTVDELELYEKLSNKIQDLKDKRDIILSKNNPFAEQLKDIYELKNHYSTQILEEKSKENPFNAKILSSRQNVETLGEQLKTNQLETNAYFIKGKSIVKLTELSAELRAVMLNNAIKDIETQTNSYLETYFDAEIRVNFKLDKSDNLDVEIYKNSHLCVYSQLSKGQRQLLKLSFSVSIMKAAANKAGVHFDTLFMDEALDGLDTELKLKAFSLFEKLSTEHNNVILIDHCTEFKSMFTNQYHVTLVGDISQLEATGE